MAFPGLDAEDAQKVLVINPQMIIRIPTTTITSGSSSSSYGCSWFYSAGSSKTNYYREELLQKTPTYSLFKERYATLELTIKETIETTVEEKRWKRWVGEEAMHMEEAIERMELRLRPRWWNIDIPNDD
ncbi:hypothetical protein ACFX2C_005282 [Malus domestica]